MTITQQQIIALAVEAGMHIAPNGTVHASQSELETLVYAAVAKETQARQAAQHELEQYRNEAQQRAGVLIKEAYQRGVRDERERCVKAFEKEADSWKAWPQAGAAKRKGVAAIYARNKEST